MQGGWFQAPARAVEVLRGEGPRSLYFKVLGETVYRRLRLIERDISENAPPSPCKLAVECRRLEPGDVEAYLRFRPEASRDETLWRLEAGHLCVAVWRGREIIHAGWAGLGRCWIEYLDLHVEMAPDAAYVYEVWTAPEYRGQRVSSARWAEMNAGLLAQGVRREIGAVWPENYSVIRSAARGGYRSVGLVGYWGAGGLRWTFCRYSGSGAAPIRLAE